MNVEKIVEWVPQKRSWLVGYEVDDTCAVAYRSKKPDDDWGGWPFMLERLAKKLVAEEQDDVAHEKLPAKLAGTTL